MIKLTAITGEVVCIHACDIVSLHRTRGTIKGNHNQEYTNISTVRDDGWNVLNDIDEILELISKA